MAIYEYHCKGCSNDFELMRSVAKMTSTAKCPKCGARATRKLTMFAVVRGAADGGDELGDLGGGGGFGDDDGFDMGDDDFGF